MNPFFGHWIWGRERPVQKAEAGLLMRLWKEKGEGGISSRPLRQVSGGGGGGGRSQSTVGRLG